jgi:outer membrane protein assembly factor BamB
VVGPPSFHPLKTVDIITAGTTVIALDHENKKIWQGSLNFPVFGGRDEFDDEAETEFSGSGLGPCVERGDAVYIFDQGSLAAFDRATGSSRWRLPSVGISGLWFDAQGMIYVNTTTASPEKIRYSKQVDLNNQILTQILKVDPKTGKTLWSREGAKHIAYMWKQYLYTTDSFEGDDPDGEGMGTISGVSFPAFLRIRRIDAGSGRIVWEHVQPRCPLDMHFHENTIQLMFRKEVQHLKFLML